MGLLITRLSSALKACTDAEKVYAVFYGVVTPHLHVHLTARYPDTPAEYLRNVAVRGGYRLVPWWLRRAVYRPVVALFSKRPGPGPAGPEPPERGREKERDYDASSAAAFWRDSESA